MKIAEGTIEHGTYTAFQRYIDMLKAKKVEPENLADDDPTSDKHLLWMCIEAKSKIGHGWSLDKASRWLGFVQGCLIMKKYTTVRAERDITRPWLKVK